MNPVPGRMEDPPADGGETIRAMAVLDEFGRPIVIAEAVHLEDRPVLDPRKVDPTDVAFLIADLALRLRSRQPRREDAADDLCLRVTLDPTVQPRRQR